MKNFGISKEWFERKVKDEEGLEIGAGSRGFGHCMECGGTGFITVFGPTGSIPCSCQREAEQARFKQLESLLLRRRFR